MNNTEETKLIQAMTEIWNRIGADCFKALEKAGEDPSMDQEDVIIEVLEYLHVHNDKQAIEKIRAMTYEEQMALGRKAFPHPQYGW